jgi:vitamin B12 transporter
MLNAGTAFKAPSFNDLYYPDDGFFRGNPNLKPERSRNIELALEYREGNSTARLSHYRNRLDDLIAINPDFSSVDNLAHARIVGTHLRVSHKQNHFSLRSEFTFQGATDDASGKQLPRRARRYGSFGAGYQNGDWQFGCDVIASSARYDALPNTASNRMAGYALLNLLARAKLSDSLNLQARIENAGDKNYELAQGYNTTGRRIFAGLEWQLK